MHQSSVNNKPSLIAHSYTLSTLPFKNVDDITNHIVPSSISRNEQFDDDQTFLNLINNNQQLLTIIIITTTIAHFNTQCIISNFAKFQILLDAYKYDVITLLETCIWLDGRKVEEV